MRSDLILDKQEWAGPLPQAPLDTSNYTPRADMDHAYTKLIKPAPIRVERRRKEKRRQLTISPTRLSRCNFLLVSSQLSFHVCSVNFAGARAVYDGS